MPAVCPSIFTISIHALREEGDSSGILPKLPDSHFYPRPPRGGRQLRLVIHCESSLFLSTPSARRATSRCYLYPVYNSDFYPRPPRGGRRPLTQNLALSQKFLSTPSARRATPLGIGTISPIELISIHALREEGDTAKRTLLPSSSNFYPRPPRGGRLIGHALLFRAPAISIHALREEGDC